MTATELIARLRGYLDLDKKEQKRKRDEIHTVLKKLKKKQRALEEKLENTSEGKKRKKIKRELKVLYVQRKKGVEIWRAIDGKK